MTLGENKKVTLALIEEYSPNNNMLTDDEDIATRLNLVYSTSYQELSQSKRILKTAVIKSIEDGANEEGYTEYDMPEDLYKFSAMIALTDKNETVKPDYKIVGKKIYIKTDSMANYVLEYYAYPTIIKEDTPDTFELEIDQDVQLVLPYAVANDILKTDPSADYTAFYQEYQRKLQTLDTSKTAPTVVIEEGVL